MKIIIQNFYNTLDDALDNLYEEDEYIRDSSGRITKMRKKRRSRSSIEQWIKEVKRENEEMLSAAEENDPADAEDYINLLSVRIAELKRHVDMIEILLSTPPATLKESPTQGIIFRFSPPDMNELSSEAAKLKQKLQISPEESIINGLAQQVEKNLVSNFQVRRVSDLIAPTNNEHLSAKFEIDEFGVFELSRDGVSFVPKDSGSFAKTVTIL